MNRRDVLFAGGVVLVSGLVTPSLTHATESKAKDERVVVFMEFIYNYKKMVGIDSRVRIIFKTM